MTIDERLIGNGYVDVCAGPMTPAQIKEEVAHYMHIYRGNMMIVTIDKTEGSEEKPYCAIYVSKKTFIDGAYYDS